jgi:CBS domain containing-hemolysin-like protein
VFDAPLTVIALAGAVLSVLWAGLLVLAEEAPTVGVTIGSPHAAGSSPSYRGVQVARLALLVIAGACASGALTWWRRPPTEGLAAVAVAGLFLYVVGDLLPRGLGGLAPRVAAGAGGVARRTLGPFRPLLAIVDTVERGILGLLPPNPHARESFGKGQRDMLLGLFSLRDTAVADIMTPRLDIVAVEAKAGARDVLEVLRRSEHARIPVYTEDLDDIVGILYAKDLMPSVAGVAPPPPRWHEIVRPAQFVPESKSLAAQLRDFQRGPSHLAIVVDEFGGTSGLITLEDILEEVVGEIYDEYDVDEEPEVEQEGNDRFWVDGRVTLDDLSDLLGVEFEHEDVSTVGGLIYSELGRVPQPGEELRIGEFRVVVERVVRRRVERVYFERLHDASAVEAGFEGDA